MSFTSGIELNTGPSPGLRLAGQALGLVAFFALCLSTAGPAWIAAASCVLIIACVPLWRYRTDGNTPEKLVLRTDGSATLTTAGDVLQAQQIRGNWSSRLCSVVVLREVISGRQVRCLVCRSANGADDYRRLLVWLRIAGSQRRGHPEQWT